MRPPHSVPMSSGKMAKLFMNKLTQLKVTCIRRAHMIDQYNQFKEAGKFIPEEIVNSAKDLLESVLADMLKIGFDGRTYLKSPEGQADLLMYTYREAVNDEASDRCGRCVFMTMHSDEDDATYDCLKGVDLYPEICKLFEDSGADFCDRLIHSIDRCDSCRHCFEYHSKIIDVSSNNCRKKLDQLAKDCHGYEEKYETEI